MDHEIYERPEPVLLQGKYAPLGIGGQVVEVDTTDFQAIDYAGLLRTIRSAFTNT